MIDLGLLRTRGGDPHRHDRADNILKSAPHTRR